MHLVNEFLVEAPPARAWAVLSDVETIVTCVPGAEVVGRSGDDYEGRVTVKVGPVSMRLAGVVTVVTRDDTARRLVVRGRAKDVRGQGGVAATIAVSVGAESAAGTQVKVLTDLDLSGPVGQLGAGMVRQVNRRILAQFTDRLRHLLQSGTPSATGEAAGGRAPGQPRLAPSDAGPSHARFEGAVARRMTADVLPAIVGGLLLGLALSRAARRSGR